MPRVTAEIRSFVGDARRAAGISQAELAKLVGVSRQTIGAIERGDYNPSTRITLRLALILSTPVEELFALTDADIQNIGTHRIT